SQCIEQSFTPSQLAEITASARKSQNQDTNSDHIQNQRVLYSFQHVTESDAFTIFHNDDPTAHVESISSNGVDVEAAVLPRCIAINNKDRTIREFLFSEEIPVSSFKALDIQPTTTVIDSFNQSLSVELLSDYAVLETTDTEVKEVIAGSPEGRFSDYNVYTAITASCLAYRQYFIGFEQGLAEVSDGDAGNNLSELGLSTDDLNDDKSGLHSKLFVDTLTGKYILAFRGTADKKDWATNLKQGIGFKSRHYQKAMATARKVHEAVKRNSGELIFTGHSLGGGLAYAAAAVTDCYAITFNAAGVHAKTTGKKNWDSRQRVLAYAVKGEPLTHLQDKTNALRAEGVRKTVDGDAKGMVDKHSSDQLQLWLKKKLISKNQSVI
ncbi:MAG: hypothetical protein ACPGUD_06490, partial [Parashewanella sp.]